MCFSLKKIKNLAFFLNNSKYLRLGEKKQQQKQTKTKQKNVPGAKYSLHDKSNKLDFP